MKEKTINILGVEYKYSRHDCATEDIDLANNDWFGYTDPHEKVIRVMDRRSPMKQKTLDRHELLHAIFFEAGAIKWYNDEDLVWFLSMQWDRIKKIFKDGGCL